MKKLRPLMIAFLLGLIFPTTGFAGQETDGISHHVMSQEAETALENVLSNLDRPDSHIDRDKYRHPVETLKFIGLEPSKTVIEIWPGGQGGYYRAILQPFFEGKGTYIPVTNGSNFPDKVDGLPYGEVDTVMVFRAHGFMIYNSPAQDHVNAIYSMLKPGGIFTIVDHAGDESIPQDPKGENGYVNESHFRKIATKAGFKVLSETDINRNARDNKNHPNGVYSLPPTLSGSFPFTDTRKKYLEIGESDRFTLKFYKPK